MATTASKLRPDLRAMAVLLVGTAFVVAYFAYPYWAAASNVRYLKVERNLFQPRVSAESRTLVVRSREELQAVVEKLHGGPFPFPGREERDSWLQFCGAFEDSVRKAEIDFATETLLLILCTEGSGSVEVGLSMPRLRAGLLSCSIWRSNPGLCTCDMAYHCFAVVVRNDNVADVEIWSRGERREVVSLARAPD